MPKSYVIDASSNIAAETYFPELDLGYATEDWLLDSDASQSLPCPSITLNDSSNSNFASPMTAAEYPFNQCLDSSSFWWHDLSYPTSTDSSPAGFVEPLDASLLTSQNWSTELDTLPNSQADKHLQPPTSPVDYQQSDNLIQLLPTAISPLDGYLADSEDEAYGSCEERKGRGVKQAKRQPSSEPMTVAPSDLCRRGQALSLDIML